MKYYIVVGLKDAVTKKVHTFVVAKDTLTRIWNVDIHFNYM